MSGEDGTQSGGHTQSGSIDGTKQDVPPIIENSGPSKLPSHNQSSPDSKVNQPVTHTVNSEKSKEGKLEQISEPSNPERKVGTKRQFKMPEKDEKTAPIEGNSSKSQVKEVNLVDENSPQTPQLGRFTHKKLRKIHAVGDIHGWAPGLISYLIEHKLAEVEINGIDCSTEEGMNEIFPSPVKNLRGFLGLPSAGLKGQPGQDEFGLNSSGHYKIKARWTADDETALVQVGDIFDRADHSELAAEVLRQLIIDAPGRVFVLAGNHEQFMLEEDLDNWYFNEVKSAYTDVDKNPKMSTRSHFRFYPSDGMSINQRATSTFNRYLNSTWALFLTQAAVLQKLGWFDSELDFSKMLDDGWAAYINCVELKERIEKSAQKKAEIEIPGVISALLIGDTLFHHAEPSAHRPVEGQGLKVPLDESMSIVSNSPLGNISFKFYQDGSGKLQGSPDSPLLWSRGSSSGVSSGNPAVQEHISGLVKKWKGLRRIVHGHTPTTSSGHFDGLTDGKSTTISYLADAKDFQPQAGRANAVRVYNIDEGMSPVYYVGDSNAYSPTRQPVCLRFETDELSQAESASLESKILEIDSVANIEKDVRNLWKWKQGEWRVSSLIEWTEDDEGNTYSSINYKEWRGVICIPKAKRETVGGWLTRRVGGTAKLSDILLSYVFVRILKNKDYSIPTIKESLLKRTGQISEDLIKGDVKSALRKTSAKIILMKEDKDKHLKLILINSTKNDWKPELRLYSDKKTFTVDTKILCEEIRSYSVKFPNQFLAGFFGTVSSKQYWDGEIEQLNSLSPVIGYFGNKNQPKFEFKDKVVNSIAPPKKKSKKENKTQKKTIQGMGGRDINTPKVGSNQSGPMNHYPSYGQGLPEGSLLDQGRLNLETKNPPTEDTLKNQQESKTNLGDQSSSQTKGQEEKEKGSNLGNKGKLGSRGTQNKPTKPVDKTQSSENLGDSDKEKKHYYSGDEYEVEYIKSMKPFYVVKTDGIHSKVSKIRFLFSGRLIQTTGNIELIFMNKEDDILGSVHAQWRDRKCVIHKDLKWDSFNEKSVRRKIAQHNTKVEINEIFAYLEWYTKEK